MTAYFHPADIAEGVLSDRERNTLNDAGIELAGDSENALLKDST